jgi:tripartite-type tricarboxylate transporter receptor subunit TctC
MKNKRRQLLKNLGILLAFLMVFSFSAAFAADSSYPGKPVRLVIPFPPGGSNDIFGRLIAAKLTERLGKQVIADNRGGAGGLLGTELAARAGADGYTLLIAAGAHTLHPALHKLPFDPVKSFVPVAKLGSGPNVLVVYPGVPANSLKELIALAKQKPGHLIFGSTGVGGTQHMGTELFKLMAGIDYKIVQFKGGGPAMTDLLGGHSHALFSSLVQALPNIKAGRFRVLGTGGLKRSVLLPDVPTIAEAGVPGYESTQWWGILAPAGTPPPIVNRLNNEIKAILTSDEVKNRFLNEGAEIDYMGSADFGQFIVREITQWTRVVKELNIKVE